jgi:protein O-mannosyl-transferase
LIVDNPYVNSGLTREGIHWAFTFQEKAGPHTSEGVTNVWAPLTFLSHALDIELWGMNPKAHHLTNLVIHLVNTCLAFGFFFLLSRRVLIAMLVAAVFCFHPMRVESVAWISERKDVLSGIFIFVCLILYYLWASRKIRESGRRGSGWVYWGALLAFTAGCLAKPTTVVLPGLLVLLDVWPLRRIELTAGWSSALTIMTRQAKEKWPFLLVVAGVSGVSIYLQYAGSHGDFMASIGFTRRMIEMPALVLYYLERTLLPFELFPNYPRYPHAFLLYSVSAVAVLATISVSVWRYRKICPALAFGWVWFLLCLIPVLGIVYVGSSFSSDRYTYIAHCGLAFGIGQGLYTVAASRPKLQLPGFALTLCLVLMMGLLSFRQVAVWKDTGALFRYGVQAQPNSTSAWNNLGAYYDAEAQPEKALECFRVALTIRKDHDVYYNIGLILGKMGAPAAEQAEAFRNSLSVYPHYIPALRVLGFILTDAGSSEDYNPTEGCQLLEEACNLLDYRGTPQVTAIVKRLLKVYDESGDREGYMRVLNRAENAGILRTSPSP